MISATSRNVARYTVSLTPGMSIAAALWCRKPSTMAITERTLARTPGPRPPYHALIATAVTSRRWVWMCASESTPSPASSASAVAAIATP
jgi:hypothetical protein